VFVGSAIVGAFCRDGWPWLRESGYYSGVFAKECSSEFGVESCFFVSGTEEGNMRKGRVGQSAGYTTGASPPRPLHAGRKGRRKQWRSCALAAGLQLMRRAPPTYTHRYLYATRLYVVMLVMTPRLVAPRVRHDAQDDKRLCSCFHGTR
jgi:hypothetical protein